MYDNMFLIKYVHMKTIDYKKKLDEVNPSEKQILLPFLQYSAEIEKINDYLNMGDIKHAKKHLAILSVGIGKEMQHCTESEQLQEVMNPFDEFAFVTHIEELKEK